MRIGDETNRYFAPWTHTSDFDSRVLRFDTLFSPPFSSRWKILAWSPADAMTHDHYLACVINDI